MSPQDKREAVEAAVSRAISRTLNAHVDPVLSQDIHRRLSERDKAVAQATNAILALRQPGAEYRRAVKYFLDEPDLRGVVAKAVRASLRERWGIGMKVAGTAQIADDVISAIRLLPESTKGEGRE
jgi:hypothetical protein